jgi:hypothetical protein
MGEKATNIKVLVLGTGPAQRDLCENLHQKCEVYAVSNSSAGKCSPFLKEFSAIDIRNKEAVLQYAQEIGADRVCSAGSDLGMVTAAWVSGKLQLPALVSWQAARTCHHKSRMRQTLGGMPGNLKFRTINGTGKPKITDFPIMIKPVDSQGQRGVGLAGNAEEFEQRLAEAMKFSHSGEVIAEEWADGPEISANGYFIDAKLTHLFISDRIVWPGYSGGLIQKHRIPSSVISPHVEKKVYDLMVEIGKKVGVSQGPVYSQLKVVQGVPKVVEWTPRLDGCHLWRLIEASSGINLMQLFIEHIISGRVRVQKTRDDIRAGTLEFFCEKPGYGFCGENFSYRHSFFHELYYDEGERVKPVNGYMEKCGYKIEMCEKSGEEV